MKSSMFIESQIIKALKENKNGKTADQISRVLGINKATSYNWRKQYGGMEVSQLKELKEFREENAKLKRLYADQALMSEMVKNYIKQLAEALRNLDNNRFPLEYYMHLAWSGATQAEKDLGILNSEMESYYYQKNLILLNATVQFCN